MNTTFVHTFRDFSRKPYNSYSPGFLRKFLLVINLWRISKRNYWRIAWRNPLKFPRRHSSRIPPKKTSERFLWRAPKGTIGEKLLKSTPKEFREVNSRGFPKGILREFAEKKLLEDYHKEFLEEIQSKILEKSNQLSGWNPAEIFCINPRIKSLNNSRRIFCRNSKTSSCLNPKRESCRIPEGTHS